MKNDNLEDEYIIKAKDIYVNVQWHYYDFILLEIIGAIFLMGLGIMVIFPQIIDKGEVFTFAILFNMTCVIFGLAFFIITKKSKISLIVKNRKLYIWKKYKNMKLIMLI